ncbi:MULTISPECIES: DUF58 domain-containing protein [Brachybacterium]|uniref:DUF58 domain-containing protein n=2 Tax=Brachybacterium alimentarium TaxID=47845 RepID=A0A2A3YJ69_9MICO|nr:MULTISPECIES: DUF58 domain-containing protein [Brachybacterium]PCC35609.1 DUF58 domain-containing protein [Brachybacterium alimentarium]PCC39135.1 DUF58 domain-containing protein [Brachybacterium alimentarium]RCS64677.1 DUF58 domain-containing protein [Brachybacterium sp. JB7]RCS66608.1 DUF58 domain-containing protein [Brachybacterium alimentarium]RCS82458.1 DUF58 domain-containing protein [Brachybacterium alimentarium]
MNPELSSFPTATVDARTARAAARGRHVGTASRSGEGARLGALSPLGRAVLVMATLCWIIGLTLHVTELNVIALVLTVPLVVATVFVQGTAGYAVTVELRSQRVVAGARAFGRVAIANPTGRPLLPTCLDLAAGPATAQLLVPRLAPAEMCEEWFAVPTKRRTVLRVGPVRSAREDPLSLMSRQITWTKTQELYVHPRTVGLDEFAGGFVHDLEGTPSSTLSSSDLSFHALRDHAPGDDRRHVHWRTTARTGKLMVRQFEETRRTRVMVALDNLVGHYALDEEFELAVSVAASVSLQTLREDKELRAFSVDACQRTGNRRDLMDDYANVASTSELCFRDLGQKVAELAVGASTMMIVIGSRTTAGELSSVATRLPAGVRAVAIRCSVSTADAGDAGEAGDIREVRSVAEAGGIGGRRSVLGRLEVVSVGSLEELSRALQAVTR